MARPEEHRGRSAIFESHVYPQHAFPQTTGRNRLASYSLHGALINSNPHHPVCTCGAATPPLTRRGKRSDQTLFPSLQKEGPSARLGARRRGGEGLSYLLWL